MVVFLMLFALLRRGWSALWPRSRCVRRHWRARPVAALLDDTDEEFFTPRSQASVEDGRAQPSQGEEAALARIRMQALAGGHRMLRADFGEPGASGLVRQGSRRTERLILDEGTDVVANIDAVFPTEGSSRQLQVVASWCIPGTTLWQMLAMFRELDVTCGWFPLIEDVTCQQHAESHGILAAGAIRVPLLPSWRFSAVIHRVFGRAAGGMPGVVIVDEGVEAEEGSRWYGYEVPSGLGRQISLRRMAFQLREVSSACGGGQPGVEVSSAYAADTGLPRWMLPEGLIMRAVALSARLIYRSFTQQLQKFGETEYPARIAANEALYSELAPVGG